MASVTQRLAAPGRLLIPPFPEPDRQRVPAWIVSFGIHAAALVALLCLAEKTVLVPPARTDRVVFVEPAVALPPPAPKGEPLPESRPQPPLQPRLLVSRKVKTLPPPVSAPTVPPAAIPEGDLGAVVGEKMGVTGEGNGGGERMGLVDAPIPAVKIAHPPTVISQVLPEYPPLARARGLEGVVVLRAVVDRQGSVEEGIAVEQSNPFFDAAAIAALRRWRFQPGKDESGQAVRVLVVVPMRFRLR